MRRHGCECMLGAGLAVCSSCSQLYLTADPVQLTRHTHPPGPTNTPDLPITTTSPVQIVSRWGPMGAARRRDYVAAVLTVSPFQLSISYQCSAVGPLKPVNENIKYLLIERLLCLSFEILRETSSGV